MSHNTVIFIDGDNIHINNVKFTKLFNKINSNNNILIKRVYGDWKLESMNNFWNNHIIDNGLEEIQISRLSGKNSTDSKIIVDIMDLISYSNNIDKIILIGCDKDYIPLIRYCVQYNYIFDVYGLRKQTSKSIINSCSDYYDIEEYIEEKNIKEEKYYSDINVQELKEIDNDEILNTVLYDHDDEPFNLLNELITESGVSISELKKYIRDKKKKEIYGKSFNKLSKYIENNYNDYFKVKVRNGKVMIYKIK